MATSLSLQDSINQLNEKNFYSLEEEIASQVNLARFKHQSFIDEIVSTIKENTDNISKTIVIKEINKTVYYHETEILESFLKYIEENNKTLQILEDFSFLMRLNKKFITLFKNEIKQEKKLDLFQTNGKKNIDLLRNEINSESYYGYYIENIPIKNINSLLLLIILEEFVFLNRKSSNKPKESSNVFIENDGTMKIDTICFLSNNFSTICINLDEIAEKNYNIYILLLSRSYYEKDLSPMPEANRKTYPSPIKEKKTFSHLPRKYDKIYIPNMQIPKSVIKRLVLAMDSDNDFKVTLQDIINFAQKHFIYFEREVEFFLYFF